MGLFLRRQLPPVIYGGFTIQKLQRCSPRSKRRCDFAIDIDFAVHVGSRCLNQPQAQLPETVAFVAFNKILNIGRQVPQLQITALAKLVGDILGDILRPPLGGVEGDHPDWVGILTRHQALDDVLKVRGFPRLPHARPRPAGLDDPLPCKPSDHRHLARSTASNLTRA